MQNIFISVIRTWTPIAVGAALAWLATKGIDVDENTSINLVAGLTGLISAVYYALIRFLENKWAWFGYLLGSKNTPKY